MPRPLDYMPVAFRVRNRAWVGWLVFSGALLAVGVGLHSVGHGSAGLWLAVSAVAGLAAAVAAVAWWRDWTYECRIEGSSLCIRSPIANALMSIPIEDIQEIAQVRWGDSTAYELVVRNHGRLLVEGGVLEPLEPFKTAIHRENPAIRFTSRNSAQCYECGADFVERRVFLETRCPACGARLPTFGKYV